MVRIGWISAWCIKVKDLEAPKNTSHDDFFLEIGFCLEASSYLSLKIWTIFTRRLNQSQQVLTGQGPTAIGIPPPKGHVSRQNIGQKKHLFQIMEKHQICWWFFKPWKNYGCQIGQIRPEFLWTRPENNLVNTVNHSESSQRCTVKHWKTIDKKNQRRKKVGNKNQENYDLFLYIYIYIHQKNPIPGVQLPADQTKHGAAVKHSLKMEATSTGVWKISDITLRYTKMSSPKWQVNFDIIQQYLVCFNKNKKSASSTNQSPWSTVATARCFFLLERQYEIADGRHCLQEFVPRSVTWTQATQLKDSEAGEIQTQKMDIMDFVGQINSNWIMLDPILRYCGHYQAAVRMKSKQFSEWLGRVGA